MNTGRRTTHFTSDAPVPLYFQIQAKILQEIESGRLQPGSMIPTERQLATLYRISIGTVKKAILNLVGQGYLYRTQGKGTFVAGTVLARESLRRCAGGPTRFRLGKTRRQGLAVCGIGLA